MAHKILFNLASVELTSKDSSVTIKKDGKTLGSITISKGTLDYFPRSRKKAISLSWKQFDSLMKKVVVRMIGRPGQAHKK